MLFLTVPLLLAAAAYGVYESGARAGAAYIAALAVVSAGLWLYYRNR